MSGKYLLKFGRQGNLTTYNLGYAMLCINKICHPVDFWDCQKGLIPREKKKLIRILED